MNTMRGELGLSLQVALQLTMSYLACITESRGACLQCMAAKLHRQLHVCLLLTSNAILCR